MLRDSLMFLAKNVALYLIIYFHRSKDQVNVLSCDCEYNIHYLYNALLKPFHRLIELNVV